MTAAAGFPIASIIPGGQKVQSQSGTSMTSSTKNSTAGSAIISFRTGMEALVSASQTHASNAASPEALEDQLAETGAGVGTDTKSGFLDETDEMASQVKSTSNPLADQRLQASVYLGSEKTNPAITGPAKSDGAASMRLQAAEQQISQSGTLPASTATKATAGKSSESERSAQTKPAHDGDKAPVQTSSLSNQGFALAPVHLSNLNLTAAPVPQHSQTIHAGAESGSATLARAPYTSSALSTSIGAESESQGKNLSGPLAVEDSIHTASGVSTAKAQALHVAAPSTATTAQSALQHADAPAQSPAGDLALQSQIKAASEQSLSGNAANTSATTEAEQTRAASSHTAATREHNPLQHQVIGDTASQSNSAIGSHTALARDAAGMSGQSTERGSTTTGTAQTQQSTLTSPTPRDTFAALDADPGQPATTWTHTSPRQVEAGYQDPALGWVSVRADLTAGGLHASVVPNSPEAAQALGNHLAGLNAYLAEYHGSSITASVAAPEDRSMQQSGSGSEGQPGAHQQNESSQSSTQQVFGQTSISSALSTSNADPELFTPTHNGRISVLA
ncbi:hypothetical protein [Terracidiphilus gabretensis]|uniref:hypothetical protein n=1 Tax=Terracidiphilus gabretensis TaxID=1577687 RepID=UPI0012FC9E5C|nr:hypothetical protein [Terracidiphilus gabretensis]